jgi:probable F420-dependent oxidoreductase
MPLAVSLPVVGMPLSETVDFVRACADLGYEEVWGSEVAGPDFPSLLGAVAAGTDARLGVAVSPVQTRSPWLLAATAATLSHLSGGRFSLGLGTSSELIVQRWSGIEFERPLTRLRETVEVVRAILAGERVSHDGDFFSTDGYRLFEAPPAPVPIVVGALNEKSLRQAGEIGDGLALNQFGPEHLPQILAAFSDGARAAGKDPAELPVVARIFCAVTDDVAGARAVIKHVFSSYAATPGYNRFFSWLGFAEEMRAVREAFAVKDRQAAAAALSDAFVDSVYVLGDEDEVADRVQAYVDGGVTIPAIAVLSPGREEAMRTLRAVARVRA